MGDVGRNDPCPCGSGKKYKKCCLGQGGPAAPFSAGPGTMDEIRELLQGRSFGSLKEAEAFVGWQMAKRNPVPVVDFEGLSPEQMSRILDFPFDSPSLLTFPDVLETEPDAPVIRLFSLLADAIGEAGLKATAKGNLPRNFCRTAALTFLGEEEYREHTRFVGINSEPDFSELHVTRLVAELAGLIRYDRGKFILSQKNRDLLTKHGMRGIYPCLFRTFVREYEWGYLDRYPEFPFIQSSFVFSLFLLARYGDERRLDTFYTEKFLRAFPLLLQDVPEISYTTPERLIGSCYSLRTFTRFAEFMGLVEIERTGNRYLPDETWMRKTPLLDVVVRYHL
jgi:hypothetical protein